ncbi:MAG TPA: hypothetical protein VGD64_02420 [Acidisarcina sp.]
MSALMTLPNLWAVALPAAPAIVTAGAHDRPVPDSAVAGSAVARPAVFRAGFACAAVVPSKETPKTAELPQPFIPVAFYRKHTEALLRRYMHLSMEMGRTPSALGNCTFPGRVSTYKVRSFEDAIIFVFDIEKCMKRLDPFSQALLNRIALQEYTQGEAAELVGQSLRSVVRKYSEALDSLTAVFLEVDLLSVAPPRSCQERG